MLRRGVAARSNAELVERLVSVARARARAGDGCRGRAAPAPAGGGVGEACTRPSPSSRSGLRRSNHVESTELTRYMRSRGFATYDELWRWSVTDVEAFWASLWEWFEIRASRPYTRVLGRREMPGAEWFPGRGAVLRRARVPRPRGRRGRARARVGAAAAGGDVVGRAAPADRGDPGRPAGARSQARRPGGRLHAEHRGDGGGVLRRRVAGGDLVERLAGLRGALRDRSVRADRAEGPARGRRLPLRRQGLRPQRDDRTVAARDPVARAHLRASVPRDGGELGRAAASRVRARVRTAAVRPPALGALLVGDDGAAEGDRARPGRHPARAPEDAPPALRRASRRAALLVHDDRLDDVEPAARRAPDGLGDRPLRRQPGDARPGPALGPGRGDAHDLLRDERLVHRCLHEGGRRAAPRARPLAAPHGRLDRVAALARGLPLGLRARRRGHLAVLDERRHRRGHGVRRRRPDPAGVRGRAAGALARRRGRGVRRARETR